MRHLNLHIISLVLLLGLLANSATAGPLRDWLSKRNADMQEAELMFEEESASAGFPLPKGAKLLKDVPYGESDEQKMDVYLPAHAEKAPVIFMVHGGAWRVGGKAMNRVVENKVARWVVRGFILVSTNYRMLPEADPLMQADDVARALAAAQAKAPSWGADPERFIVMGHSAGAHLVALLAASPSRAQAVGAHPWLGTIALDSAVLDVVQIMKARHYRFYDKAFGKDDAYWKSASPLHVLVAGAKPLLLVCSATRQDKPCDQAKAFGARAAGLGVRTEISQQQMSHREINERLGLPGAYTDTVEAFMGSLDAAVQAVCDSR